MGDSGKRPIETRTEKHRRTHKLLQTWVSPATYKAFVVLAKNEGRTIANFLRREVQRITGIVE